MWRSTFTVIVIVCFVALALLEWKTEVHDRNRLNHSYAIIKAENLQCLRHLQKVSRMPSWRRHVLLAVVAGIILSLTSSSPHVTRDWLINSCVVFLALETSRSYNNWHIMCHANCV